MRALARGFITSESDLVLQQLLGSLRQIQISRATTLQRWEIARTRPLTTNATKAYERGNRGRHHVSAQVSALWEVACIRERRRRDLPKRFGLVGNASVLVRLLQKGDSEEEIEVSRFRMEIGDVGSPGCYFHIQVGNEGQEVPFPRWLSIPRYPAFFATPCCALEFALGELFQDEWRQQIGRGTDEARQWHPLQNRRITNLLNWQQGALSDPQASWMVLKSLQPTIPEMFDQ